MTAFFLGLGIWIHCYLSYFICLHKIQLSYSVLNVCEFNVTGSAALRVLSEINLCRIDMDFVNGPLVKLFECTAYPYYE